MKALLVEDVAEFGEVIRKLVKKDFPDLELIGPVYHQNEVIELIQNHKPDILLMDIMLNEGTSFDILKKYKNEYGDTQAEIIFITAHPTYNFTQKALDYSALSFLRKPVDPEEFKKALSRTIAVSKNKKRAAELGELLEDSRIENLLSILESQNDMVPCITLHLANGLLKKVDISSITYFEADGQMCDVHLADGGMIKAFRNLGFYKKLLIQDHPFFTVSNSLIVNIHHLESYQHHSRQIRLINGSILTASRRGGQLLKSELENQSMLKPKPGLLSLLKSSLSKI